MTCAPSEDSDQMCAHWVAEDPMFHVSMLLPSLGSVVHVVVAKRLFHELSCLFHHTVMSLNNSCRCAVWWP